MFDVTRSMLAASALLGALAGAGPVAAQVAGVPAPQHSCHGVFLLRGHFGSSRREAIAQTVLMMRNRGHTVKQTVCDSNEGYSETMATRLSNNKLP